MRITFAIVFMVFAAYMAVPEAWAENEFSVGAEGFRDVYKEPGTSVDTHTNFSSVTLSDRYNFADYFVAVEGRYSTGDADYKSVSGNLKDIPDKEGEARLLGGLRYTMWHGVMMPYIGVGTRLYFDQGKGLATDTGNLAYDRHIFQNYIPIGVSEQFMWGDWKITPNIEYDALFYGWVSTHLGAISPHLAPDQQEPNVVNIQHKGFGARSELMVGQQYKYFGWEAGPFVRYWNTQDSDYVYTPNLPAGYALYEPDNKRIQYGVAARVNF